MDPKILKNPTNKDFEFMYDGRVVVFKAGEVKAIDGDAASLALEFNNTPLVEASTGYEVESNQGYTSMSLPKLLKLAKSKGIKTKFGMKKVEVIGLLVNG